MTSAGKYSLQLDVHEFIEFDHHSLDSYGLRQRERQISEIICS